MTARRVVRYYSPTITVIVGITGLGMLIGALIWAGTSYPWPTLLAFCGGTFASLALGRSVLAEEEIRDA